MKVTGDIVQCCSRILACGRVVPCNSPCSGVWQHNVCVPCSYSARQLLFHISIHTIIVSIDGPYAAYMERGWCSSPLAPIGYATHPTPAGFRSITNSFLEAFKSLGSIVTPISLQDYGRMHSRAPNPEQKQHLWHTAIKFQQNLAVTIISRCNAMCK